MARVVNLAASQTGLSLYQAKQLSSNDGPGNDCQLLHAAGAIPSSEVQMQSSCSSPRPPHAGSLPAGGRVLCQKKRSCYLLAPVHNNTCQSHGSTSCKRCGKTFIATAPNKTNGPVGGKLRMVMERTMGSKVMRKSIARVECDRGRKHGSVAEQELCMSRWSRSEVTASTGHRRTPADVRLFHKAIRESACKNSQSEYRCCALDVSSMKANMSVSPRSPTRRGTNKTRDGDDGGDVINGDGISGRSYRSYPVPLANSRRRKIKESIWQQSERWEASGRGPFQEARKIIRGVDNSFAVETLDLAMTRLVIAMQYWSLIDAFIRINAEEDGEQVEWASADEMVYADVIAALGNMGEWRRAADVFHVMEQKKGIAASSVSYSSLIQALMNSGEWARSTHVFRVMMRRGIIPGDCITGDILKVCSFLGHWELAIEIIEGMKNRRQLPKEVYYADAVQACSRSGRWKEALQLYDELCAMGYVPDRVVCTGVISACEKMGEWKAAMKVFKRMELEDGVVPNVGMWTALVSACATGGEIDLAWKLVFDEMKLKGVEPNVVTWSVLVDACGHGGDWRRAEAAVTEMQARGCVPNLVTWTALIRAYGQAGLWHEAMATLRDLLPMLMKPAAIDGPNVPDAMVWNTVADACARAGQWRLVARLIDQMQSVGVKPTVVTYAVVIKALGSTGRWKMAWARFAEMLSAGIKPNVKVCNAMLRAYAAGGQIDLAEELFNAMPLEYGLTPDKFSYTALIHGCGRSGAWERAEEVLEKMKRAGCKPDLEVYRTLWNTYTKTGQVDKAMNVKIIMDEGRQRRRLSPLETEIPGRTPYPDSASSSCDPHSEPSLNPPPPPSSPTVPKTLKVIMPRW
ncbi:hypothetical protein CBR_g39048 [Chara braunii]|uniref:Pentacotripeptide-repeat region of PRORP domain-containing protein n=1 Tax=Chara braunii TaxID=69332 RepID=A0A388LR24_CHABU|nr:hypothetical protein CBR_g39048 [Chara braunii]|eukprot:GBG84673.1 hypothetical protein CBR_g39048 [Chara braunii]